MIIKLSRKTFWRAISEAERQIERGNLIVYPTDTLYGLGAKATSDKAVRRVYEVKGREEKKPISVMVSDIDMLERYAYLSKHEKEVASSIFPGPYTLLLKPKRLSRYLSKTGRVGFRIPDNRFCIELSRRAGPITSTSANLSGRKAYSIRGIMKQLGDKISLYIDSGILGKKRSTLIDPLQY
ncbi:MAG: threonylcarbamoyl-AMP synthase [Candidatus Diapherotrites archaeon]|nr:threonylcarbamoyl-AMP synthase [Candidatus Diapherotrites archaeon]